VVEVVNSDYHKTNAFAADPDTGMTSSLRFMNQSK
jgi:hypothetical protein